MSAFIKSELSYRVLRGTQIATVFFFMIVVQEMLRYPHAGWSGFALMMIYGGFDNGTTLIRAYDRFLGVILGLFLGYILWFLGHIDYRTMFFVIPATIYMIFFWAGTAYIIPTIFTVSASLIGYGYFDSQSYYFVTSFLIDYGMCTLITFSIIVIFEYFWFRHYAMMRRFINDIQAGVIHDLSKLIALLNQDKIRRTDWFKGCIQLIGSLYEMDRLLSSSKFMATSENEVGNDFNQFVLLTNRIYTSLKALYFAYYTKRYKKFDYYQLAEQIQTDVMQLKKLMAYEQNKDIEHGVLHASSN